jgi:ATP/maltotriose-dependent transcriptional regulator MalT
MQSSVHISKIIPPQIPQILLRPRLVKSLQQQQDKKLILILGQAAQGKSTLAASYVSTSPVPSAWINLGPEDTDAVTLYHLLGHALKRALPEVNFSSALGYPTLAMGPREEGHLYRDWLHVLLQGVTAQVRIILDGLDRLPFETTAYDLVQVLLTELPPQVRLFILSREMPLLPLQSLAERKELFILTNADLAFNLSETTSYFHQIRNFHLSDDLVRRIHQLTEGWIGGLVLFCDSLDWVPENQRERYVSQELAGKFIWNIFQYFGEKVLAQLPREVQEFLIKSSILEVVEPDFVEEAMGLANPQAILDGLVQRNLFIQSIYDKKGGWSYKYHPLFKEFLQGKFQTLMVREQQVNSYYQAASLSERRKDLENAVRFYLRAQAYPEAAHAVEKAGGELVKMGKTAELAQWLTALPQDLVQHNPWLLFYLFITKRFTGAQDATAILEAALTLFEEKGEMRGRLLALAHLLEASVIGGRPAIPLVALIEQGEDLLAAAGAEPFPYERAVLLFQLGFAHFMRSGNPYKGYLACQNAYLLAKSLGDVSLQFNALLQAYANLTCMGEFAEALQLSQKVDELLEAYPYPGPRALHFLHLGILHLRRGDLDQAATMIRTAQELTEKHGLANLALVVLLQDLVLKYVSGSYREAEALGQHLLEHTRAMDNRFFHGMAATVLGTGFYFEGEYRRAREMVDYAQEILASEEGLGMLHLKAGRITCNLISHHFRDRNPDEQELHDILDYFTTMSMPYFAVATHLTLALVTRQRGQAREAAVHVTRGLRLAKEKGYCHSVDLTKNDVLSVCLLALELEAVDVWDYVTELLTTCLADLAAPELTRLTRHDNRTIADKAWEIRQAIHRADLPHLRLQTLGGFRLWRGEALVEEKEWEGHQPQLLLKAIVAHGPQGVPKDVLMEDLWPEASPHLSEKNFKVNLHRLRKTLEPVPDKTLGFSYVHLKASLVSLDPELCQVDAYQFISLCQQGEKAEQAGDFKGAIALYRQAVDLYEGDFFSEELYHPWVETKREELRERLLAVLYRLAKLYEDRGSLVKATDCYVKIVQTDPLAEAACRRLMQLYAQRGLRNAALRVYEECRKSLQEMLNTEPEEVTTAVYRKVLETAGRDKRTTPRAS